MSILPLKTKIRGPAPPPGEQRASLEVEVVLNAYRPTADPTAMDILDESIDLFRANSLFRNFEIKGPADRVSVDVASFCVSCSTHLSIPHSCSSI